MSLADIVGDLGYGFVAGTNAVNDMYQRADAARVSEVGATRQERQLEADSAQDVFGVNAAVARGVGETNLAQVRMQQDKMAEQAMLSNPQTKSELAALAEASGGVNTPQFRDAYGEYLASKGLVAQAAEQHKIAVVELQAQQIVAAGLRLNPQYAGLDTVELGEDGRLYGFPSTPDENGEYVRIDLPPEALREYAAYTGNTRPLGFALKMQQSDIANQAAASGVFNTGTPQRQPRQKAPIDAFKLNSTWRTVQSNLALKVKRSGAVYDQATLDRDTLAGLMGALRANGSSPDEAARMAFSTAAANGVMLPPELMQKYGIQPGIEQSLAPVPGVFQQEALAAQLGARRTARPIAPTANPNMGPQQYQDGRLGSFAPTAPVTQDPYPVADYFAP